MGQKSIGYNTMVILLQNLTFSVSVSLTFRHNFGNTTDIDLVRGQFGLTKIEFKQNSIIFLWFNSDFFNFFFITQIKNVSIAKQHNIFT